MRKRFALAWSLVVLAMVLALPASTLAGSGYSYRTVYNYCDGNQVNLKMKNIASGTTPANKLTTEMWAQRRLAGGWQTVHTWKKEVYKFAADGRKHILTTWRSYIGNNHYYFRIVFRLRAWDGRQLLATTTFKSVKC
jgi:hypothetical protein